MTSPTHRHTLGLAPALRERWSQPDSNRRPFACKANALPAELWPRVSDIRPANRLELGQIDA
jgi:hypothetical protein